MKTYTMYQADAFASPNCSGNPAAVIVLDNWLPDKTMQYIGLENNLSETAFLVKNGNDYDIRWFAPLTEIDLCGHATLASAFVLFSFYENERGELTFHTRKRGSLHVKKLTDGRLELNFPVSRIQASEPPAGMLAGLGGNPLQCYRGVDDFMVVYSSEDEIKKLEPDFGALSRVSARGIIVTAPGDTADFVSRFFAPSAGINEDPVTGSAHTMLIPYWAERLQKQSLHALQLSARGGELFCTHAGDRVLIAGNAVLYMKAEIYLHE